MYKRIWFWNALSLGKDEDQYKGDLQWSEANVTYILHIIFPELWCFVVNLSISGT